MRAAVVDGYGPADVVRVVDVPRPEPKKHEALVRVHASAVTSGDARIRGARFPSGFGVPARLAFGLRGPRRPVLGGCFSGVVESAGSAVADVAPGEEVCGMTGIRLGCHAEFVTVPAAKLARKPSTVSHDDAAAMLFGGTTALFFLRDKASIGSSTTVLVNGASGAVGTNAVQLAKHLGATVAAVTSGGNADLVTRLGADRVIDYTTRDLGTVSERFDVVLDTVGNLSIAGGRRLLADGGKLLLVVASLWDTLRARGNVVAGSARERVDDFAQLLDLVARGELTVVTDSVFALGEIADAHRRVDSGHKVGNVVVRPV